MRIREYFEILWRWKWIIVVLAVTVALVAVESSSVKRRVQRRPKRTLLRSRTANTWL